MPPGERTIVVGDTIDSASNDPFGPVDVSLMVLDH
jgi:hypothetical protein